MLAAPSPRGGGAAARRSGPGLWPLLTGGARPGDPEGVGTRGVFTAPRRRRGDRPACGASNKGLPVSGGTHKGQFAASPAPAARLACIVSGNAILGIVAGNGIMGACRRR